MKKRLGLIWKDITNRLPKIRRKLKTLPKSPRQPSSVANITAASKVKLDSNENTKLKEANINKAFQKDDVHPFEITDG